MAPPRTRSRQQEKDFSSKKTSNIKLKSNQSSLPDPSTTTKTAPKKNNVVQPTKAKKKTVPPKSIEKKFSSNEAREQYELLQHGATPQGGPSSSAQSSTSTELGLSDMYAQQAQILARLEYMNNQQHAYWSYAEKRDVAMCKSLQKNLTNSTARSLSFPSACLEPWTSPTSDDADPIPSDEYEG